MKNRLTQLKQTKAENIINGPVVTFSFLQEKFNYPLVVNPQYEGVILSGWIKANTELIHSKVSEHGALLFRGFQVNTVEKFQDLISVFDSAPLEYKQRSSPRHEVAKNIYLSTTYPEDQHINMHSENSYALNWAMKIVFCCITPTEMQGETPIADNRLVLKYLPEATKEKFRTKGIKYVRNISKGLGLSWQEVFQTQDRKEVEEECCKNGMEFRWENADRLVLSWNNKAIYDHPVTGEQVWFNHSFFFNKYAYNESVLSVLRSDDELPFNTYYGDGTQITKEEIEEIRTAYQLSTIVFPWQKGDVLFMDNMLMAHGRSPFKGDRKIIVSMF